MGKGRWGISHLLAAFGYSMSGAKYVLKETAFRYELLLGLCHVVLMAIIRPPFERIILLSLLYALVLIVEVLNTAIEAIVDLASPNYNDLAKKAKDLGSFGVFLSLVLYFVFLSCCCRC